LRLHGEHAIKLGQPKLNDRLICQTGNLSMACATTDTAAAIAAHAAQGDCSRIIGTSLSTLPRKSRSAMAYNPAQAEISAAPIAIQEAASLT
jgi:hypothetical protein